MSFEHEWKSTKEEFEGLTGFGKAAQKTWSVRKSGFLEKTLKMCDEQRQLTQAEGSENALKAFQEAFARFTASKSEFLHILEMAAETGDDVRWEEKVVYEKACTLLETKLDSLEQTIRLALAAEESRLHGAAPS